MGKRLIFIVLFLLMINVSFAFRPALTPINQINIGGGAGGGAAGDVNVTGFNETDYTLNTTGLIVGVNTTVIQKRVTGDCTSSQAIRVVNEDGSVTCVSVGAGGGGAISTPNTEYYNGSNSTIILNNTETSQSESVYYNGQKLRISVDYTINHKATNSNVTINIPIFNPDFIIVDYFTVSIVNLTFQTEDFTGVAILPSKNITLSNIDLSSSERVFLNGQRLRISVDYNVSHETSTSWVQIYNPIISSDYIVIDYYEE